MEIIYLIFLLGKLCGKFLFIALHEYARCHLVITLALLCNKPTVSCCNNIGYLIYTFKINLDLMSSFYIRNYLKIVVDCDIFVELRFTYDLWLDEFLPLLFQTFRHCSTSSLPLCDYTNMIGKFKDELSFLKFHWYTNKKIFGKRSLYTNQRHLLGFLCLPTDFSTILHCFTIKMLWN